MNFKPTLWKSIVSILVMIIVDFILAASRKGNCVENINTGETICRQFWFLPIVVVPSIIIGIIIYTIWSLFEKSNKRKK